MVVKANVQMPAEGAAEMDFIPAAGDADGTVDAKRFGTRGRGTSGGAAWRKLAERKADRLFRQAEQTKEWAENNYYRLLIAQQTADLVRPNRFWQRTGSRSPPICSRGPQRKH